jgi:hypothetical protein
MKMVLGLQNDEGRGMWRPGFMPDELKRLG